MQIPDITKLLRSMHDSGKTICTVDAIAQELLLYRESNEKNTDKRHATRRVACSHGRWPEVIRSRCRYPLTGTKERQHIQSKNLAH